MLRQCYAFDSLSPWLDAGKLQKSLISGLPGGIFRALARGGTGIDPAHPQRHRQTLADLLAMALKVIGCGLQAMVDAYKNGVIAKNALATTEEETNLAFTEGSTAYAVNWPYMYRNAEDSEATAGKFEVQPLVGKDGVGVSALGGYNNAININSEHKATAKDFMEFIVSEENQKSFAAQSFPPVLASIYDDAALVEEFPYLPALKESLENAKPRPVTPFYTAVSKAIQNNATAALKGDVTVDEATESMSAAITNASR